MAHVHHDHAPPSGGHGRAFAFGIGLNVAFVAVEVFYGLAADSTALLADAGHNASDVLSLVFAWLAAWLSTRQTTGRFTFGLRRTTILVALLNALLLFGAAGGIGYKAALKLMTPEPVPGTTVMIVAGIGVVINTLTALLFMRGRSDLNIKGAFLHMAVDALVSVGVVIGGALLRWTDWLWVDPALSFVILAIIVYSTWGLFMDALRLALDAVPKGIELEEVRGFLLGYDAVADVHDMHIWALSTTQTALTAHLVVPSGHSDAFIFRLQNDLHEAFGIDHATLQLETTFAHTEGEACALSAPVSN